MKENDGALGASSMEMMGADERIDPYEAKKSAPPQKGGPTEDAQRKTPPPPPPPPPPPDLLQISKCSPKRKHKKSGNDNSKKRQKRDRYSFPEKLFEMVSSEKTDIIGWVSNGKAFRVKNVKAFEEEILPKFFGHKNMRSFTRQLSYWGFNRVAKKPNGEQEFMHPAFVEGGRSLTSQILRTKLKGCGLKRGGVYISLRHTQSQETVTFINKTEMDCMQDLVTKNATFEKHTTSPRKTEEKPSTSCLDGDDTIRSQSQQSQSPRRVSVCKLQDNGNEDASKTEVKEPHSRISERFVSLENHKAEDSITTKEATTIPPHNCIAPGGRNSICRASDAGNCASSVLHRGVVSPATEEQRLDVAAPSEQAIATEKNSTIGSGSNIVHATLAQDTQNAEWIDDVFDERCFHDVQQQGREGMVVRDDTVSKACVPSWPSYYNTSTQGTNTGGNVIWPDPSMYGMIDNPPLPPAGNVNVKPNNQNIADLSDPLLVYLGEKNWLPFCYHPSPWENPAQNTGTALIHPEMP